MGLLNCSLSTVNFITSTVSQQYYILFLIHDSAMQFIGSRRQIGGRRAPQTKSPFCFLVCSRLSLKIGVKPQSSISSTRSKLYANCNHFAFSTLQFTLQIKSND